MVNFPSWISDCDSHSHALLDFFLSSDASICSTMAFPGFCSNSKRDVPFHRIAYDYSRADRVGLHNHLKDVAWEDIFKLGASAAASEF